MANRGRRKPGRPGPSQVRAAAPRTAPAIRPPAPVVVVDEGVLPPAGATFLSILRGRSFVWWRSLLGVFFALSLFLLLIGLVSQVVISLAWSTTGSGLPYVEFFRQAAAFERPVGMLAAHLAIMTLAVISAAMMLVVHQVRPRWLLSVEGRVRWRYLVICLGVAVVALNGMLLLSLSVEGFLGFEVQTGFWAFLVVIVLTTPLQAVAEEVFFRGYLLQALGGVVAAPWFGIVVSSLIFAYVHGSQNLALFCDRLAFGVLAAILVRLTGGLEAGIAAHVINNLFAFTIAGVTTSIAEVKAISSLTFSQAAFDVAGFALFAMIAYAVARRMKLRARVALPASPAPSSAGPV